MICAPTTTTLIFTAQNASFFLSTCKPRFAHTGWKNSGGPRSDRWPDISLYCDKGKTLQGSTARTRRAPQKHAQTHHSRTLAPPALALPHLHTTVFDANPFTVVGRATTCVSFYNRAAAVGHDPLCVFRGGRRVSQKYISGQVGPMIDNSTF